MDTIYGGLGDDTIHGDEEADMLYGNAGEDTIYGGDGADTIDAGTGWDTVFGGDGCDVITTADGGDVVWLGDCDGSSDQMVTVNGTGSDPENFTVIMDFWLESAKPFNQICVNLDEQQADPSAGVCADGALVAPDAPLCLSAI